MRVTVTRLHTTLAAAMLLAALQASAQSLDSEAPPAADDATQDVQSATKDTPASPIPPQQLDQMLAPLALYPDELLAQVLMAATYPLEVVQADRWLRDPNNAALKGAELDNALAQQPWDASVKSLVPFPQVLHMMDNNLTWTEQLGDAFLANQQAVMDSVQRLRQKAQAAGKLQSSPEEVVSTQGPDIVVQPADPETVYVPVYDPDFAYGDWAYPDYPPDYFPNAFSGVAVGDFGFGWFGIAINTPLWGWEPLGLGTSPHQCGWRALQQHQRAPPSGRFRRLAS